MYKTTTDLAKAKVNPNKGEGAEERPCLPAAVAGIDPGAACSPGPWLWALAGEVPAVSPVWLQAAAPRHASSQVLPICWLWPSRHSLQHFPAEIRTCWAAQTDKEHREGHKWKKINYRIIQGVTGRYMYLHKTLLVSSVNRLKSELSILPSCFFFFQYIFFQASKEMNSNHCD